MQSAKHGECSGQAAASHGRHHHRACTTFAFVLDDNVLVTTSSQRKVDHFCDLMTPHGRLVLKSPPNGFDTRLRR